MTRLPRTAAWLLRSAPVARDRRDDVEADLLELFEARRRRRGGLHAHWRLYRDLASLWRHRRPSTSSDAPRSLRALVRDLQSDLRYAARLFARQPGILLLAIVGLSLGLGIATAAFTIMNAAMQGEGLRDSSGVPGLLRTAGTSTSTSWRYDEFVRLREGASRMQVEAVLTDTAPVRTTGAAGEGAPAEIAFVSGGFFAATGGHAQRGRAIELFDESRNGGPAPVVISDVFWASRLDRDPSAVGRTIRVGRTDATIVGVAERGFALPGNRALWMPLPTYGSVYGAPLRTPETGVQLFGRLLPDASLREAEAQVNGVAAALPGDGRDPAVRVTLDTHAGLGRVPLAESVATTAVVVAVIALVLLLACANVATVLVAAAITREREMGVRAALGASLGRIVRQLVTESLALGVVAAAIGLVFASWALPVIGRMIEAPAGADLAPDLTVFLFLGIVTFASGVGAGLAPARHGLGADLVAPLKGEGSGSNRVAPRRLRFALIVAQAAASVVLLVLASLFVRATFRAAAVNVGFDPGGLYAVSPGLGDPFQGDGAAIRSFWARAIPAVREIPGVASVALAEITPFDGLTRTGITRGEPRRPVYFNRTSAEFFDAMRLRLIAGRVYTQGEIAANAPVALVSDSLARTYSHGASLVGQLLPSDVPIPELTPGRARPIVIGIVADAIAARLDERGTFAVYGPLDRANERFASLLLRVTPGADGALQQASQRLRTIDPHADVRIASVASRVSQEAGRPRVFATVSGVVGAVAIVLSVIGLYGLTAALVGQRTREMGIRAALGANRGDLHRLLMWESLRPVVLGVALGAATALAASRVVASTMLFGVSPRDPLAFGGAATILLAAATIAVVMPTRRAAAADAAVVLKQ